MLTIVDYGMGNLNSVAKAFENLRAEITVSSLASDLERADRIVLPGVGAFAKGMKNLNDLSLVEPLRQHVCEAGKPFLGLCLGMQLLAEDSYELGHHQGLGWLPATVKPVEASGDFKSIHIGWNDVSPRGNCPLFAGLGAEPNFYFVHGYHVDCDDVSEPSRLGSDPLRGWLRCLRNDLSTRSGMAHTVPTASASSDLIGAWPLAPSQSCPLTWPASQLLGGGNDRSRRSSR